MQFLDELIYCNGCINICCIQLLIYFPILFTLRDASGKFGISSNTIHYRFLLREKIIDIVLVRTSKLLNLEEDI